jgi:hypothetical protein
MKAVAFWKLIIAGDWFYVRANLVAPNGQIRISDEIRGQRAARPDSI